jgi:hypothetical protein
MQIEECHMKLVPGTRFRSTTCTTEVIVVRAGETAEDLTCGGSPMTTDAAVEPAAAGPAGGLDGGTLVGKRYTDGSELELLVVKAGAGTLALGATPLEIKSAKPLPSSD